ncbi:MAG: hypothetical protein EXR70_21710 [Deltaproteobacteria bacterium]|nr:hypothetical protein [Deltaproteobacteria bacterium]
MSHYDLDRYYTPANLARSIVELSDLERIGTCLDAACGDGSLLAAARDVYSDVQCMGIDVDASAILRLRKRHPTWILSHADALANSAWKRARAARQSVGCDLVLLNPPFSMGARKGIFVNMAGFSGRCSVAMGHILTVLMRARPVVGCAIVPESMLFSNLDENARRFLSRFYSLRSVRSLRNSTFRGGHANALTIKIERAVATDQSVATEKTQELNGVQIVRGGLPLFQAEFHRTGVPFIHSTDLRSLTKGILPRQRTRQISRGLVSGNVILLPRVGVPSRRSARFIKFEHEVQLSDCVIALRCVNRATALIWQRKISDRWDELVAMYRGTGARYVTVNRLHSWLASIS